MAEQDPAPGDRRQDLETRRMMMQTIGEAIAESDYGFVIDLVSEQKLMRPFEIVAIMDVNQRRVEDPKLANQWKIGLDNYLQILEIRNETASMPPNEAKIIQKIREKFEQQEQIPDSGEIPMDERQATADISSELPDGEEFEGQEDGIDWREDDYTPTGITPKELKALAKTPLGKKIVEDGILAMTYGASYLERARKTIDAFQVNSGVHLRLLLDTYVCATATQKAKLSKTYGARYLNQAIEIVQAYASSSEEEWAMERSLDKHVFEFARDQIKLAETYGTAYIDRAISALDQYVTTEQRYHAMLRELGLS